MSGSRTSTLAVSQEGAAGIWRWPDIASHVPDHNRITLGEGETPLVPSRRIGPSAGLDRLMFKLESVNPTGSYKDRFAAMAVSDMLAHSRKRCIGTSSGNTGAALAAYCAAAGILCEIVAVETASEAKLGQMLAYGAHVSRVRGFGTDPSMTRRTFDLLRELACRPDTALQISAYRCSPLGMIGVQSIAYELDDQLGRLATEPFVADTGPTVHVFCPAGGGGLTLAVARGFASLGSRARCAAPVRVDCVQPTGNDTIASALRQGSTAAHSVRCTTRIGGLQVADVLDGDAVIEACRASGGTGHIVDDEAVWEAQSRLATEEGIFCEPAGAAALAGALKAARDGEMGSGAQVVCLVTGTGFKDADRVASMIAHRSAPFVDLEDLRQLGAEESVP